MLTKLELSDYDGRFYTQRYFFDEDRLFEEGARMEPYRSSIYWLPPEDVDDIGQGAKYHWGP